MEATKVKQSDITCLSLNKSGVRNIRLERWLKAEAIQQRKRRALLTIIFCAYPYFAI